MVDRGTALPPVQAGLLGRAFETSRHAVFVSSYDRELILAVNQAACELLGYTREELLQATPWTYTMRSEDELDGVYEELREPGATLRGQAQLKRRDGSVATIDYWGSWVRVTGADYLLTVTDPIDTARVAPG
ncbi:MAG TPA: PAS domain S-box protein [Gaiellaceae bacterium]|nr:PAS domain S-box protein [Gaiellaceae bacterium]